MNNVLLATVHLSKFQFVAKNNINMRSILTYSFGP
jgi:hypothetical protein